MIQLSHLGARARDVTLLSALNDLVIDLYGLEIMKGLGMDRGEQPRIAEAKEILRTSPSWDEELVGELASSLTDGTPDGCEGRRERGESPHATRLLDDRSAGVTSASAMQAYEGLLRGLLLAGQEFWIPPPALDELGRIAAEGVLCGSRVGLAKLVQSQLCLLPAAAVGDVLAVADSEDLVAAMVKAQSDCYAPEAQIAWLEVASKSQDLRLLGILAGALDRGVVEAWLRALGCGDLRALAENRESSWQDEALRLLDAELGERHGHCAR